MITTLNTTSTTFCVTCKVIATDEIVLSSRFRCYNCECDLANLPEWKDFTITNAPKLSWKVGA